jgi:hypothetical protein
MNKSIIAKDEVKYQNVLLEGVQPVIDELLKSTQDFNPQAK